MSKIALSGNASGTGTFTFAAPGTNTDRTLTLPDASGTLATTADVGTGLTLLGTITTTSGSSVSLSGLTLTSYKQLQFVFEGVSGTTSSSNLLLNGNIVSITNATAVADACTGGGYVDLASGIFWCGGTTIAGANRFANGYGGASGLTTASTSITFTISAGNFDAGSIRIYGVK